MTIFQKSPAHRLREAAKLIRANPDAVEKLDAEEAAAQAKVEAEAQRRADLDAKVEAALPERTQAVIDDYIALEQDALRAAAERVARQLLQVELGAVDPAAAATGGWPSRLGPSHVEGQRKRLASSVPLPWAKRGQSIGEYRTTLVEAARREAQPVVVVDPEEAIAQRKRQLEELRERKIAAAKAAAGIPGYAADDAA